MCRTLTALVVIMGQAVAALAVAADDRDWPMIYRDPQRSGYTDHVVQGPYERKWFRDFHDELIATRVQAIVAQGRVFIPTLGGNLYALDAEDGRTLWKLQTDGPLGASPAYADGRVYQGSDDGGLYCIDAGSGDVLWRYQAEGGIFVSPLVAAEHVYAGDRAGVFHAVDRAGGERAWSYATGAPIMTTASMDEAGENIVFASETMHVYCVGPRGELHWRSAQLGGLSLRDQAPTIWQGLVIVRTNPAAPFHTAFGMATGAYRAIHEPHEMIAEDELLDERWGRYSLRWTERRQEIERAGILDYLSRNRHQQTTYALRLANGTEPWIVAAPYNGMGLHNPPASPTFNPHTGAIYFFAGSALNAFSAGVPGGGQVVYSMDPQTGALENVTRDLDVGALTGGFGQPSDESQALSLMGEHLINTHQGSLLALDLQARSLRPIYQARDSYAGIHGVSKHPTRPPAQGFYTGSQRAHNAGILSGVANEWHGPARAPVAVAADRLFWIAGAQVVCLGGPDVPTAESGGPGFPDEIAHGREMIVPVGNLALASAGTFDAQMPVRPVAIDEVRSFLEPPENAPPAADAADLQEQLDAAVEELVAEPAWAPLRIEMGISGSLPSFYRAAQGMQIVATALPQLSPSTREKAVAWLDAQFEAGYPLERAVWAHDQGARREFYALPGDQGLTHYARGVLDRTQPGVDALYAVWAYAHYADRWGRVLGKLDRIEQLYAAFASQPLSFAHAGNAVTENGDIRFVVNNDAEYLNARIAGTLGYIRILDGAGRHDAAEQALATLAALVELRMHHERADTCFIRQDDYGGHSARLPRYGMLTREVGAMLRTFTGDVTDEVLGKLRVQLPVWHHAYSERLIGGENYTNPPQLARAIFAATAWATATPPHELRRFLDHPWCRADLYYIEKLTATLQRSRSALPK